MLFVTTIARQFEKMQAEKARKDVRNGKKLADNNGSAIRKAVLEFMLKENTKAVYTYGKVDGHTITLHISENPYDVRYQTQPESTYLMTITVDEGTTSIDQVIAAFNRRCEKKFRLSFPTESICVYGVSEGTYVSVEAASIY